jgi:hypothetical protein
MTGAGCYARTLSQPSPLLPKPSTPSPAQLTIAGTVAMQSQNDLQRLTSQSISLRGIVEGLEQQMARLNEKLQAVRLESQIKDKCATIS